MAGPDLRERLNWRGLLRPGDVLLAVLGLVLAACCAAALWRGGAPDGVLIRTGGRIFAEADLSRARIIEAPGPIGITRIEIQPGRARIAADPGPRQYCVRQGWLTRAGAAAICAPNQVSLVLTGGGAAYDSLNY